jgi:hypothetical protein
MGDAVRLVTGPVDMVVEEVKIAAWLVLLAP